MKPPTTRLDQTLGNLNYMLALSRPPLIKWRNLLALIKHGKPMTAAELEYATNTKSQNANLLTMERDGWVTSTAVGTGTKLFSVTTKGQREAVKLIEGVHITGTSPGSLKPDMNKILQRAKEEQAGR